MVSPHIDLSHIKSFFNAFLLLFHMFRPFMPDQHIAIPETLATYRTVEIVDACVSSQMLPEVIFCRESFAAKFALVRVDSPMLVHVVAMATEAGESAIAQFTLVGSRLTSLKILGCVMFSILNELAAMMVCDVHASLMNPT